MLEKNWTLVLFTTLSQMVVGFFILVIGFQLFSDSSQWLVYVDNLLPIMITMLFILTIGVGAALIHLGRPFRAILALRNLSTSWLSREMLFGLLFGIVVCVYVFLLWLDPQLTGISTITGLLAGISGLILIYCMSRLYMLRTVPAWNNWRTPLAFLMTTLLLGIVSFVLWLITNCTTSDKNLGVCLVLVDKAVFFCSLIIILVIAQLGVSVFNMISLSVGNDVALRSVMILLSKERRLLWIRYLTAIGGVILLFVGFPMFDMDMHVASIVIISLAFGLIFASEVIGRHLFYAYFVRKGI